MQVKELLKKYIPEPVRIVLRPIRNQFVNKHNAELSFWKSRYKIDNGVFNNASYKELMLGMAKELNDDFLSGKIVADFGCGPRGSLVWAKSASVRIGIDVLADKYTELFSDNILSHGMIYVKSTEKFIPIPSDLVDVMFTLNAIDHVDSFSAMCGEILRVIKPGGDFIGSFNLEEPATPYEPQRLNEKMIKDYLLNYMDIQSYRISVPGPEDNLYAPFFDDNLHYKEGQKGILWVRAKKRS